VLIGKDALQSEFLVMLQYRSSCVYFVQTCKAKQAFGYVELDEIREETRTRPNCDQTQWKGLNIKSDISINMDVFNRRYITQFRKDALDYDVDLSNTAQQESFILIYVVFKRIRIVFKIHIYFMLDRNL